MAQFVLGMLIGILSVVFVLILRDVAKNGKTSVVERNEEQDYECERQVGCTFDE